MYTPVRWLHTLAENLRLYVFCLTFMVLVLRRFPLQADGILNQGNRVTEELPFIVRCKRLFRRTCWRSPPKGYSRLIHTLLATLVNAVVLDLSVGGPVSGII